GDNAGADDVNLANRRAAIDELADAVTQRHIVDADNRLAVARERDVAQLEPAYERALQAADAQGGGQILVGFTNDQRADLILGPPGLKDQQRRDEEDERKKNGVNEPAEQSTHESERTAQHPLTLMLTAWSGGHYLGFCAPLYNFAHRHGPFKALDPPCA